jgi:hypothetical protein
MKNVWSFGQFRKLDQRVCRQTQTPGLVTYDAQWVVPLALIFALLLLTEMALPAHVRFTSISPHPYWIPVVLISAQYGTTGGLAAALTAIALRWMMGVPVQEGGEEFYEFVNRVWREPILWLGAGAILGGFRAQERHKFEVLRDKLLSAERQRQSISSLFNHLKLHSENLERAVACAEDRSIESGLVALAAVRNAQPENLRKAIAAAVELLLGRDSRGVLVCRDERLIDSITQERPTSGQGARANWSSLPSEAEEALQKGNRVLSVLRDDDIDFLDGRALFAAPVMSPVGERLVGALLIQALAPEQIGPQAEMTIQAICREISHAFAKQSVVVAFERDRNASRGLAARGGVNMEGRRSGLEPRGVGKEVRALK